MTRPSRRRSFRTARAGRPKARSTRPIGRARPGAGTAPPRRVARRSADRSRPARRGTARGRHASLAFWVSPERHRPSAPSRRIVLSYRHARVDHRHPAHPVASGLFRPGPHSEHSAIGQPHPCPPHHRARLTDRPAALVRKAPPGGAPYYRVPYGQEELEFMLQPWFDLDIVESATATPIVDLAAETVRRLQAPLGGKRLRDLAADAVRKTQDARAVIAVTDLTRASPDAVLVPPLLGELNAGGIPDARITVIVAIGLHRATTDAEKREKLGSVVDRVRIVDSNGRDPALWADLGTIPPYNVPGFTQKLIKEADLVVATGIVEPHQYAGYSGGRKTVASGCAGEPVITATHGMRFLEDPGVRLAKTLGNPFHETANEIARRAGLRFCVNVVTDDQSRVVAIEAGAPDDVLRALIAVGERLYPRPIAKQYDIAIAGVGD